MHQRTTHQPSTYQPSKQAQYVVLRRDDVRARQAKAVHEVASVLGLSDDDAARVLRRFKWCAETARALLHSSLS